MSTNPRTPSLCRGCQKLLDAPTHPSGLCRECLRTTDLTVNTSPELPPPIADLRPLDPTVTFAPSPETASFRDTPPQPLAPQSRLDRLIAKGWLQVRPLGVGGMGALYVGYAPGLQRTVVAKFILPQEIRDGTRRRFRVEAASLARLSHPNVARLYEYVDGDDPYLVLDYVAGGSLADRLRQSDLPPLTVREAAELVEGMARGVAAAHAEGVIHRDLKPGNLLLDTDGPTVVAKVTDFGMARDVTAHESLTVGDAVIGTPEYMAPEQAGGHSRDCTARSDVWGLAATLYAAVTGVPPFTRDMRNPPVLHEDLTPPEVLRPDLPAGLAAVIKQGLEKHPDDRYQTAAEFADDLKRFLAGEPVRACPRAWPVRVWRRAQRVPRMTAVSVALAVVAVVALVAMFGARPPQTPDQLIAGKMDDLSNGKPATLIGEGELPVWQKPLCGAPVINHPPNAGGSTALTGNGFNVVALTPPLPIPEYTVEAELRDVDGVGILGKNAGMRHHHFGLMFGLAEHESAEHAVGDAKPVTNGLVSGYEGWWCDLDRTAGGKNRPPVNEPFAFGHRTYETNRPATYTPLEIGITGFEFLPLRIVGREGPWRKVTIDVRGTGVTVSWGLADQPPAVTFTKTHADLAAASREAAEHYRKRAAGPVALPEWPYSGGIGLTCFSATVAVRNLVITPR